MPYGPERRDEWRRLNEIARANHAAIDRCDALVAVLDGADVDSGTAAEVGYAFARRKPIVGYRGDVRLSADNEGAVVNLQVEYFIHESGGCIVRSLAELSDAFVAIETPATEVTVRRVSSGRPARDAVAHDLPEFPDFRKAALLHGRSIGSRARAANPDGRKKMPACSTMLRARNAGQRPQQRLHRVKRRQIDGKPA